MGKTVVFFDISRDDEEFFAEHLGETADLRLEFEHSSLDRALAKQYQQAEIVSVGAGAKISAATLKLLPKLELVACRGSLCEDIDIKAATKAKVLISILPPYRDQAAAEYTLMLLLAVMRKLPTALYQVEQRRVDYYETTGTQLSGKTVGIIGYGGVAQRVIDLLGAFTDQILVYTPGDVANPKVRQVQLDELLRRSDVISLHANINDQTKHILDINAFSQMKNGVVIINTAHGSMIESKALLEAIYSGRIGGVGLDAVEGDSLLDFGEEASLLHPKLRQQDLMLKSEQSALGRQPNVIITPHVAFNTAESIASMRESTVANIKHYLIHQPQNIINPKY